MKDRLFDALRRSTADHAEIRVELCEATELAYRGREIERADSSSLCGGMARACTKGGWGIVTFDSLAHLERQVAEAGRCAALTGRERTELAEAELVDEERRAVLSRDFREVSLDEKIHLIRAYNEIILGANPRVESSFVRYTESLRTVYFASTRGAYYMEERPRITCLLLAAARDGSVMQRAWDSVSSSTTYDAATGLEARARAVADRAQALLRAPKADGGRHTVILNPTLAGILVHEAFGHLSEADTVCDDARMRDRMAAGREVGPRGLNVVDDGGLRGFVGSSSFDDEGTPTRKTHLIRDGCIAGHLHSLETAAKMGEEPTGNARAAGRHDPPIVRMTNTYIDKGDLSVPQLFTGVDRGVYACDTLGGCVEGETFDYSAAYGYRIENREVGELVRDVTLAGNVFDTLRSIDGIAADLTFRQGAGGCGKSGQMGLPVSEGSPHIRIRDVVVAGRS